MMDDYYSGPQPGQQPTQAMKENSPIAIPASFLVAENNTLKFRVPGG
jgi:hypothetical protein